MDVYNHAILHPLSDKKPKKKCLDCGREHNKSGNYCGTECISNHQGFRQYWKNNPPTPIDKKCKQCGGICAETRRDFCSRECFAEYRKETSELAKPIKTCPACGKTHIKHTMHCNRKCRHANVEAEKIRLQKERDYHQTPEGLANAALSKQYMKKNRSYKQTNARLSSNDFLIDIPVSPDLDGYEDYPTDF